MIREWAVLGLALAAFGVSGCNQRDRSPTQPEAAGGIGSARIALPRLPAGYLPDSASQAWFSLSITGSGMAPILSTWPLSRDTAPTVVVSGIPAGVRAFLGRLIRIDAVTGDTVVTHEGIDTAFIARDSVTTVFLYLKAGGGGTAHVCIEVEGWPSDSSCIAPPPPPPLAVEGCYSLTVAKPGPVPDHDSIFTGSLHIEQRDSILSGSVTWESGQTDSAYGILRPDGGVYLGWGGNGAFFFYSQIDSSGSLEGWFQDSARGIWGEGRAFPKSCGPDTSIASRRCYAFTQTDIRGLSKQGRVAFAQYTNGVWRLVYTHWEGYPSNLNLYALDSLDTTSFRWNVMSPAGVLSPGLTADSAAYVLRVSGDMATGEIRKTKAPYAIIGSLTGSVAACRESDFGLN